MCRGSRRKWVRVRAAACFSENGHYRWSTEMEERKSNEPKRPSWMFCAKLLLRLLILFIFIAFWSFCLFFHCLVLALAIFSVILFMCFFSLCASFQSIFTSALSPILVWLMGLGSDTVLEKQNKFGFVLLIFVQLSFVWVTSLWTFLWPFRPWEYCAQWDTFQHQLASFVIRYCWFWYAASACSPAHCAGIQMLFLSLWCLCLCKMLISPRKAHITPLFPLSFFCNHTLGLLFITLVCIYVFVCGNASLHVCVLKEGNTGGKRKGKKEQFWLEM